MGQDVDSSFGITIPDYELKVVETLHTNALPSQTLSFNLELNQRVSNCKAATTMSRSQREYDPTINWPNIQRSRSIELAAWTHFCTPACFGLFPPSRSENWMLVTCAVTDTSLTSTGRTKSPKTLSSRELESSACSNCQAEIPALDRTCSQNERWRIPKNLLRSLVRRASAGKAPHR